MRLSCGGEGPTPLIYSNRKVPIRRGDCVEKESRKQTNGKLGRIVSIGGDFTIYGGRSGSGSDGGQLC